MSILYNISRQTTSRVSDTMSLCLSSRSRAEVMVPHPSSKRVGQSGALSDPVPTTPFAEVASHSPAITDLDSSRSSVVANIVGAIYDPGEAALARDILLEHPSECVTLKPYILEEVRLPLLRKAAEQAASQSEGTK